MIHTYATVLRQPGALAFSAAGVAARLPMSMVGLGIVLMVERLYDSYALAGQVSAANVIAHALCAPQLARLVDRRGQARIMRPAVTLAATSLTALVVTAATGGPVPLLFVFATLAGATVGSIGALVRARWSFVLTDPRQVHTAYSLESALDELVFIIGPVVVTLLATGVAPAAGLVLPIVAMLVGGHLFLALRATEPPPTVRDPGVRHGHVLRSGGMVVVVAVFVAVGAIFGATDVATVAFAEAEGSPGAAGAVLAVFAAGSMLAGLGYGARHWASPLWLRFATSVAALAVGVSLFFVVTSLPALAAVMFVTGFAIAPSIITGNGLVQQLVEPGRLTEGLTWVSTSLGVGVALGASSAGALIDVQGPRGGFLVVVAGAGLAVVATLVALPTLRTPARTTPVARPA
ncbi:MFS transporter [Cellulomonas carbonis]|uniref:Major facilitator transporter n=1 Tax=Cellulomonas carbonis T26 TaxID=947969 RepID=A0A0A0BS15_9CELL|nr:MFS transporter [Cellulomonas carbonis]KGM10721.1 major facilitator transporter [Cellulomonas carbonis T26]GGC02747.1 MFS transporter [Cellulomonas carbonis]